MDEKVSLLLSHELPIIKINKSLFQTCIGPVSLDWTPPCYCHSQHGGLPEKRNQSCGVNETGSAPLCVVVQPRGRVWLCTASVAHSLHGDSFSLVFALVWWGRREECLCFNLAVSTSSPVPTVRRRHGGSEQQQEYVLQQVELWQVSELFHITSLADV